MKRQCWVNEFILNATWLPESQAPLNIEQTETIADEDLLDAVLDGTFKPLAIPVTVTVPHGSEAKIRIDSFARGSLAIEIALDPSRPRGLRLEVGSGMDGVDRQFLDTLEEVCRRGGGFTMPGRLWNSRST